MKCWLLGCVASLIGSGNQNLHTQKKSCIQHKCSDGVNKGYLITEGNKSDQVIPTEQPNIAHPQHFLGYTFNSCHSISTKQSHKR